MLGLFAEDRSRDRLRYVPDRTGLRLRTGPTHVISLILDPHDEILGFGQSMVSGLAAALRNTPYHLVITPNFRNVEPTMATRAILSMLNWMARWYKPEGKIRASEIARGFADMLLNGLVR